MRDQVTEEGREGCNSGYRYQRDLSTGADSWLAGFPHSATRTTSWRPTANFLFSSGWQLNCCPERKACVDHRDAFFASRSAHVSSDSHQRQLDS